MSRRKGIYCAAIDLGASAGRVIVGQCQRGKLTLTEIHRFPNQAQSLGGHDYWDLAGLWAEVGFGLLKAKKLFPNLASVGVDTWGVDHVLVDVKGRLVFPAHAYRDRRTQGGYRRLNARGMGRIYQATGVANYFYNTSLQLEETVRRFPATKATASRCLFLADYFNFLLSGRMVNELSIASTSQLLDVKSLDWSSNALAYFGIPQRWFASPIRAGRSLGAVRNPQGLGTLRVILVPGHDTACAYDAMPTHPGVCDIYVSCGTWSLIGFESASPLLGSKPRIAKISNERMSDGRFRPLTSVTGLWLLESTLHEFAARPRNQREWMSLIAAAERKPPAKQLLDLTDPAFSNPTSMRGAIDRHLRGRREPSPADLAAYVRLICDSLGRGHADAVRMFERISGRRFERILLTGGGAKNRLVCQATANASSRTVVAVEIEGTALGNIANQLVALGAVKDLATFRRDYSARAPKRTYLPQMAA